MDYKFLITLGITIAGWCVSLGVYMSKIKQHEKDIQELKQQQKDSESKFASALQNINTSLTDLNTKMNLLLEGRIIQRGVTE